MATIDASQDYDFISTLTFDSASGTCNIRLYRGSSSAFAGTVYYRNGTSGSWTSLSVSGTATTFPVGDTTMQVANDWNKNGNDYMTQSFFGQTTNLAEISISQKAIVSGVVGNYFFYVFAFNCPNATSIDSPDISGATSIGNYCMYNYAGFCSDLTTLEIPKISGLTSVGSYFMRAYAADCSSLLTLEAPDTSNIVTSGEGFMYAYAEDCSSLTSLGIPDTSSFITTNNFFMDLYANRCNSLERLELPVVGWFASNNIDWSVPSGRLNTLKGYVKNSTDLSDWQGEVSSGETLYTNYIRSTSDVVLEEILSGNALSMSNF